MAVPHTVDVLVIGGGATGAGVLRDLARTRPRAPCSWSAATSAPGRPAATTACSTPAAATSPRTSSRPASASTRTASCAGSRRRASRTPAATSSPRPTIPTTTSRRTPTTATPAASTATRSRSPDLLGREPALNPKIRRAFRVPDGSIEPWQLIDATIADARRTAATRSPTSASSAWRSGGGPDHRGHAARRADRAPCPGSGPGSWSPRPAPGRARSRRSPTSRSR